MSRFSDIRDAATVLLVRDAGGDPSVLMGQRGAKAAFMPSKFVFPGGAVDPADDKVPLASTLGSVCKIRLQAEHLHEATPEKLATAGIRELWEETGLRLARPGAWTDEVPDDWRGFAEEGLLPDAAALTYIFRAITPPGRPRRFDARFFATDAARLFDSPDDFSRASDELSHLQWVPIRQAMSFDLPFITRVVLAELTDRLPDIGPPPFVPFFDNRTEKGRMIAL